MPYICKQNVLNVLLNKIFPSFINQNGTEFVFWFIILIHFSVMKLNK